jgi:hypothetical protein
LYVVAYQGQEMMWSLVPAKLLVQFLHRNRERTSCRM